MTAEPTKRRFLTIEQAAEELNSRTNLIRGLIKTGELRAIKIGAAGHWRIGSQDLEDYIADAYQKTAERIAAGDLADDVPESE